jgi:hypothetical protein
MAGLLGYAAVRSRSSTLFTSRCRNIMSIVPRKHRKLENRNQYEREREICLRREETFAKIVVEAESPFVIYVWSVFIINFLALYIGTNLPV